MNTVSPIFAQLIGFASRYEFNKCVKRYAGNLEPRKFFILGSFPDHGFCPAHPPRELEGI